MKNAKKRTIPAIANDTTAPHSIFAEKQQIAVAVKKPTIVRRVPGFMEIL